MAVYDFMEFDEPVKTEENKKDTKGTVLLIDSPVKLYVFLILAKRTVWEL